MGSNTQVEFMIGSLPLAVLTQRCARTSELTRRRDFISSFPLHPSSLLFTPPPLASNDLLCFARSSRSFKHHCLVQVIKRHDEILQKRIPDSAAVLPVILARSFRIKDYGRRIDV